MDPEYIYDEDNLINLLFTVEIKIYLEKIENEIFHPWQTILNTRPGRWSVQIRIHRTILSTRDKCPRIETNKKRSVYFAPGVKSTDHGHYLLIRHNFHRHPYGFRAIIIIICPLSVSYIFTGVRLDAAGDRRVRCRHRRGPPLRYLSRIRIFEKRPTTQWFYCYLLYASREQYCRLPSGDCLSQFFPADVRVQSVVTFNLLRYIKIISIGRPFRPWALSKNKQ